MTPPVHHHLFRAGLALGLVTVSVLALLALLAWDGFASLPDVIGAWLDSLLGVRI